jgi:Arc/MetJ family transcription regulator
VRKGRGSRCSTGPAIALAPGPRFRRFWHNIHMKRTNLVLNADLLEMAVRVLGVKTYSAAVNLALEETLRVRRIQSLPQFFGQRLWEGNLSEMREDQPPSARRRLDRKKGRR